MEITPAETRLHFELIAQEDSETKSQKYQPVVLGPKAGCLPSLSALEGQN